MAEHQYKNIDEIFQKKAEARKQNAKIPFAEKLQVVLRLQREAYVMARSSGREPPIPWHTADNARDSAELTEDINES
jgi:hypothetical protein